MFGNKLTLLLRNIAANGLVHFLFTHLLGHNLSLLLIYSAAVLPVLPGGGLTHLPAHLLIPICAHHFSLSLLVLSVQI